MKMAIRVLFTKFELPLVKNNKYLTLKEKYDKVEQSHSSDDDHMLLAKPTPRLNYLY